MGRYFWREAMYEEWPGEMPSVLKRCKMWEMLMIFLHSGRMYVTMNKTLCV